MKYYLITLDDKPLYIDFVENGKIVKYYVIERQKLFDNQYKDIYKWKDQDQLEISEEEAFLLML